MAIMVMYSASPALPKMGLRRCYAPGCWIRSILPCCWDGWVIAT